MKKDENSKNNHLGKEKHAEDVLKKRQDKKRDNGKITRKRERIEALKAMERARKKAQKTGDEWLLYMLSLQRGR